MELSSAPAKIVEPVCNSGSKNAIPVASNPTPGGVSFDDGFPPLTMTPVSSGGVPPSGLDMNGLMYQTSAPTWWANAGAGWKFDATFATAVGGYPAGARVLMASGNGYWLSIIDNNSNNPDTGGAGWIPDKATASVWASTQQTLAMGNSKVLWDTVDFDTFGLWNAGGRRFQALWAGKYRLSGSIYLANAEAPQLLAAMVYHNGTLWKQCDMFPADTDQPLSYSFDAIVSCAIGDYLEAFMSVSTTGVLAGQSIGSSQAYVFGQLEYLGP